MLIDTSKATQLLAEGSVVAIPTDTVYGFAARIDNDDALDSLYALKGRPNNMPLLILGASLDQLSTLLPKATSGFNKLATNYWPGALSIIVDVDPALVSDSIRRGRSTTGFRVPNHPDALELLRLTGPLAVTSANRTGDPAALSCDALEAVFGDDFPILSSSKPPCGTVSTIIELEQDQTVKILREGEIPGADVVRMATQ